MANRQTILPIKQWAAQDRPRERLFQQGRTAVTDTELLAILLGSGNREETALCLARKILASQNEDLTALGKMSVAKLCRYKGVGAVKAGRIMAALELGRRMRENVPGPVVSVSCSRDAYEAVYPVLADLPHEEFWIIYLNNNNRILHLGKRSQGGINGTLVDVRLVLKEALEQGAVALILAHNHPSGNLEPSTADKALTLKMKKAAEALDLKVLDHIILGGKNYYSFADQNAL